jgi:hypothetical protein
MQCAHVLVSHHVMHPGLRHGPVRQPLGALAPTSGGDAHAACAPVGTRPEFQPAGGDKRLEIACQRRRGERQGLCEITRAHGPVCLDFHQQPILRRSETNLAGFRVIVLPDEASELMCFGVGALRLLKTGETNRVHLMGRRCVHQRTYMSGVQGNVSRAAVRTPWRASREAHPMHAFDR